MALSQHRLRKLQEVLGADAADDLVTILDGMDANRGDIGELRHEVGMMRADMTARFEKLETGLRTEFHLALEKGLREQMRFFFLAWAVLLASNIAILLR